MTDAPSTSVEGLEGLRETVKDYQGYAETPVRQHSDKVIRKYLSGKIIGLLNQLSEKYNATDEHDQNRLDTLVNSTKRKLVTINSSLKSPTYIQESFFQTQSIPAPRLARIYYLEKNMLEETHNINVELSDLYTNSKERAIFEEHFFHIDAFVDNINQALFEREALILGDE